MSISNKVFITQVGSVIDKAFKSNSLLGEKLSTHMSSVIGSERLMKALEKNHPGETVYFGDKPDSLDQAPIYKMLGITADEVRKSIRDTKIVQSSWAHANKPIYWTIMGILRNNVVSKKEEHTKMSVLFMATAMYAGLQFRYFRRFYQPNAMAYAMNTLVDKFTLKQEGTIIKTIMAIAWRSHEKYKKDLMDGTDAGLLKYLVSMWGRLNGLVKALKNHYEEVKAKGLYLNQSRETHDDGSMLDRETVSGRISTIADTVSEAFYGEAVPIRLIEMSAKIMEIPRQSLILAVDGIRRDDPSDVRTIILLLTELFFEEEKASRDDIRTRKFIEFANSVYTRSNTRDGRIETIKEILNRMLTKHSPQFLQTNREATKGAFRKALYLLIVFFMQYKV